MAFQNMLIRDVSNYYGVRVTDLKFGAKLHSVGQVKSTAWTFDFDDLPVVGTNKQIQLIPINSYVMEAYFQVITAFTGSSGLFDIDLVEPDGTSIGSGEDKLWDDLALASIDSTEVLLELKSSTCASGSNSGDRIMEKLTAAGNLQVAIPSGSFTAGRARIVVEYLTVPPAQTT